MTDFIPYGRQDVSESDIEAVVDVLRSDFLTQGPAVPVFERLVSEYCDARHAVAVNSATSALHIACLALGLGKGDWLWTSPITFVASANCGLYCGARVDFVDIDQDTYNMSVDALREKLEKAEVEGNLPKVVIPVHFTGQSSAMREIKVLADRYGFYIIEDAAHAIGGKYHGEPVGNCRYSDITVFSFHPVKIITTGEGGMALTNSHDLAHKMRRLRSHGITNDPCEMVERSDNEIWNYQQMELGFNYRMTDIQAALGVSQMMRIDEFVTRRHEIADRYNAAFVGLPIKIPWQHPDSYSSYHLYPIRLQLNEVKKKQRQIYNYLRIRGVLVNLHYVPVYRQPYYEKMGFEQNYCPEAECYYSEVITIPMYPGLSNNMQDKVIVSLLDALKIYK